VFIVFKGLSSIGGVGGGAIAKPLIMAFFGINFKVAVAISSFAITVATLTKFITSFSEKNPDKLSTISIDYQVVNVMMPLTLVGAFIGAYVYVVLPDLILQILLTILLLFLTI
jgi:uncharacterized protein